MSGDHETYEWYTTPYGDFRIEQRRFGTWTSFDKDGKALITGGTREAVLQGTGFHLEGVATNWANCTTSKQFDGTVGGKL
jgi:hypothetical protein|tara:strand:- start:869 stop:1108 length:240 start_codon:yes stop_codon:yes gene_type:complete